MHIMMYKINDTIKDMGVYLHVALYFTNTYGYVGTYIVLINKLWLGTKNWVVKT